MHQRSIGAISSQNDATRLLKKYNYKLDAALDGLYSDPVALAAISSGNNGNGELPALTRLHMYVRCSIQIRPGATSTKKVQEIFDQYRGKQLLNAVIRRTRMTDTHYIILLNRLTHIRDVYL